MFTISPSVGQCYFQVTSNLNMSQLGKVTNNDIIGAFTLKASVGQCYCQVISNVNMLQQGKGFKQRYYGNIHNFSLCRLVLLSGNVHSEHVAKVASVQATILSEFKQFENL